MDDREFFTILAGDPTIWDAETRALKPPKTIFDLREDQWNRGRRRMAILGFTSIEYPTLTYKASLLPNYEQSEPLGELRGNFETIKAAAVAWANEDPKNREVYMLEKAIPRTSQN